MPTANAYTQYTVSTPSQPTSGGTTCTSQTFSIADMGKTIECVKHIQFDMNLFGINQSQGLAPLVIDGDFGYKTLAAVQQFQYIMGMNTNGVVGPSTWNAIAQHADAIGPGARGQVEL